MLNTGCGRGAYNVLDAFETGSTELVAVVDMLHMLAYAQQGALLTTLRQGPRKLLPLLTISQMEKARLCSVHCGFRLEFPQFQKEKTAVKSFYYPVDIPVCVVPMFPCPMSPCLREGDMGHGGMGAWRPEHKNHNQQLTHL